MNQTETDSSSSQVSRCVLGTLGAVAAFAIAGGIWMHADEETAHSLAGGVATARISAAPETSAAPEISADPSLPRAGDALLPQREEAAEASPTF